MQKHLYIFLLAFSSCLYAQNPIDTDSSDLNSIKKSMDILSNAAKNWTPEQKKEFADVFFIERGKFTIPKDPIVLKSFDTH